MKTRLIAALLLAGCTSSEQHDIDQTITITPQTSDVMTCSTAQFTAAVTGFDDLQVSWSANHGSVDASGLYTSPMTVQDDASVTATSKADPNLAATAQITLATAFPSAAHAIASAPGTGGLDGTIGVYQHEIASRGDRVYTIWPNNPAGSSTPSVKIARSDDGGATWQTPTTAVPITLKAGTDTSESWAECAAVAIDAGNPDIVYATARISGASQYGAMVGAADEPTLIYAVSIDGGATFTQTVLRATTGAGICADIISPKPNAVIVDDPTADCDTDKDVGIYADANRGAGFATGTLVSMNEYEAHGETGGLASADKRVCTDPAKITIETNGTSELGGEATESPRMFADAAGRVCISYIAVSNGVTGTPEHAYEQCSDDLGVTFDAPVTLDPATPAGTGHSHTAGAFGPNHAAAVAFIHTIGQRGYLFLATSTDGGTTFGAPAQVPTYSLPGTTGSGPAINPTLSYDANGVLWIAYRVDDGNVSDRIVVDKSCDGGTTWSGPVLVNGTEQQIIDATFANMKWPVLVPTTGKAPRLVATGTGATNVFDLAP